jgi:hypothetical protein
MERLLPLAMTLAVSACLSATPGGNESDVPGTDVPGDAGGDPQAPDPGEDPAPGWDLPLADPEPDGSVPDLPAEEVEPDCGFAITSFTVQDGRTHLRMGELAHFETVVDAQGAQVTVTYTAEGLPSWVAFEDHGDGTADMEALSQTVKSRTTPVTVRMRASHLDCAIERTITVKVLGTVWATEYGANVVQVFRSDGTFIGQGIPSGLTSDPWCLLELGPDRILVGSRHKIGAEVYDLDGNHLYSFDTVDQGGGGLFGGSGAYTAIRHRPDGDVWIGGPYGMILVFEDDGAGKKGRYKKTLEFDYYRFGNIQPESLIQLGNDKTAMVYQYSIPWSMVLMDTKGDVENAKFADNSNELKLVLEQGAVAGDGFVVGGRVQQSGFLAVVRQNGIMDRHSGPIADFVPEYGVVAFGQGFLAATSQLPSTVHDSIVYFGADLVPVVDPPFSGDKTGGYRGLMVLGGN